MSALLDRLLELQKQHSRLHELKEKARLAGVAVAAKDRQVGRLHSEIERLTEDRKKSQRDAGAKELEVKSVQSKIQRMREQLNVIKTNKEYQALKNEIRFAEIELRRFEDEELEKLDRFEQDAAGIVEAQAALKKAEDETAQFKAQQAAEAAALETQIRDAERDRSDVARELPADMVGLFERVASKHRDGAMCPLVKDEDDPQGSAYSCGGCYMRLTENVFVKLLGNSSDLITCPNCSRILYLEP